jgi:transposase
MKKRNKRRHSFPKEKVKRVDALERINFDAAGVDIGDSEIVAAVPAGRDEIGIRSFGTFTRDLHEICNWFKKCGVKTVAMEATGVYWINLYELLESEGFEVYLVDSRKTKNVSGRKSDVDDSEWIYQLHTYGLLPKCFRPPEDIRKLRDLVRYRESIITSRVPHVHRMQKALQCMNIKLTNVISDITGTTGMAIVREIISGERDPQVLARHRDQRCQKSEEEIVKSLEGNYQAEQLFMLEEELKTYDFYTEKLKNVDKFIEKLYVPLESKVDLVEKPIKDAPKKKKKSRNSPDFDLRSQLYRITGVDLTAIDGLNAVSVQTVISHTGVDMSRWPSDKKLVSWLCLCPNNNISGGKVLGTWMRRSKSSASQALRVAAMTVAKNNSALGAFYRRMKAKHDAPTAVTATAAKIARIIYAMIKKQEEYRDIGCDYYEKKNMNLAVRNLKYKAARFGFELIPRENKKNEI